jgi:membrane-associated phospholipid phosphatase
MKINCKSKKIEEGNLFSLYKNMKSMITKTIAYIGSFGPSFLFCVIVVYIFSQGLDKSGVILLLTWKPLGMIINSILKSIIDEPRPKGSIHLNKIERYLDEGTRGMPSGHAQFVGSGVALSMCLGLPMWLQLYSCGQAAVTIWQRYSYKKHTAAQLGAGFFVGLLYSFCFCLFLKPHFSYKA